MKKTICILAVALAVFFLGCNRGDENRPLGQSDFEARKVLSYNEEAKVLQSVLKDDPENLAALIKLGNLSMDMKRFPEAIDAYSKALEIDPANVDVRVDMGTCYRNSGRPDVALEEYGKALAYNPKHANAHLNTGVVFLYDFGKKDEAIAAFEKFLEAAPNAPNAAAIRQEIERIKTMK
jgi:tetratricopeptide (TPR) repeat protein